MPLAASVGVTVNKHCAKCESHVFSIRVTVTHCDVDAQKPSRLIGFIFGHSVPKTLSLLSQLVPLPPLKLPNSQFRQLCPTSPLGTSDDPEVSKYPPPHTHTSIPWMSNWTKVLSTWTARPVHLRTSVQGTSGPTVPNISSVRESHIRISLLCKHN